jgi:hypothetical protein
LQSELHEYISSVFRPLRNHAAAGVDVCVASRAPPAPVVAA